MNQLLRIVQTREGYCKVSGNFKKSIQKVHVTSDNENESIFVSHKMGTCTIRCNCGCEILVVPDLKAMNRAIQNHIAEHKQGNDDPNRLALLETFLTEQVLIVASKITHPK